MSGASALAAAKRRRAVPTEPVRPTSQKTPNEYTQVSKSAQNQTQPSQVQIPAQNPLHLLLQHEQKLKEIDQQFTQLKVEDKKSNVLTPDSLQYFKTQHDLMNQEIQELKKILIKVQTFSMDTNMELLKLKKTLKVNESNESIENIL